MAIVSRRRRPHYHQERYHPIFCTSLEVEMPKLMKEYLYTSTRDPTSTNNNNQQRYINHELNTNLEQILRAYLTQFWRHEVEKEQGGCRLWDEITGFTPYKPPPSSSLNHQPAHSHNDSQWWRKPSFALDDIPPSPFFHNPSTCAIPAIPASVLSSSSSSYSTPNTTPSTFSSPDLSPRASPQCAGSPRSPAETAPEKTRWQIYAERLFAYLLRVTRFSLNAHMQLLIRMHQHANTRKDTQLADIVRNYLATVLH